MVDLGSLESLLAAQTASPWSGRVWRVMLAGYPPDRENTRGSRWNPPDVAAIYTCLAPAVCIAEVEYGLSRQSRPVRADLRKTLYEIELSLAATLDLRLILDQLAGVGIGVEQLFADDLQASQAIGRLATWLGCDGIFVPSARSNGINLVIYPGRTNESYRFDVIDGKRL